MYQQKDSQTATLYGHAMSPREARGIVAEVAIVAQRIDHAFAESQYERLPDHQRLEDLRAYWKNLFRRDLDSVLSSVAAHHFYDTPQAKDYAELWKNDIEGRTTELLIFGFLENPEFLAQAIESL